MSRRPPTLAWRRSTDTPWNGDYHLNINVQMNYWPSGPANLSACQEPLLDFVEGLVAPGKKTARAYYDAPGWVAHVIANPSHPPKRPRCLRRAALGIASLGA